MPVGLMTVLCVCCMLCCVCVQVQRVCSTPLLSTVCTDCRDTREKYLRLAATPYTYTHTHTHARTHTHAHTHTHTHTHTSAGIVQPSRVSYPDCQWGQDSQTMGLIYWQMPPGIYSMCLHNMTLSCIPLRDSVVHLPHCLTLYMNLHLLVSLVNQ